MRCSSSMTTRRPRNARGISFRARLHGVAQPIAARRASWWRPGPAGGLAGHRFAGEDGLSFARDLRERHDIGIISVRRRGHHRSHHRPGDRGRRYLAKPFDLRELHARLKSVARRYLVPRPLLPCRRTPRRRGSSASAIAGGPRPAAAVSARGEEIPSPRWNSTSCACSPSVRTVPSAIPCSISRRTGSGIPSIARSTYASRGCVANRSRREAAHHPYGTRRRLSSAVPIESRPHRVSAYQLHHLLPCSTATLPGCSTRADSSRRGSTRVMKPRSPTSNRPWRPALRRLPACCGSGRASSGRCRRAGAARGARRGAGGAQPGRGFRRCALVFGPGRPMRRPCACASARREGAPQRFVWECARRPAARSGAWPICARRGRCADLRAAAAATPADPPMGLDAGDSARRIFDQAREMIYLRDSAGRLPSSTGPACAGWGSEPNSCWDVPRPRPSMASPG